MARAPHDYDDIPGTFVFDAERSRQGYGINMFCMSLMKEENRKAFKANEAEYLKKFKLTPEQVDDAMAGDAKQPRADLLQGLHESVGLDQFVKDFLEDVLGIARIGDALANELAQPSLFAHHRFRDAPILLGSGSVGAQRFFHLPW